MKLRNFILGAVAAVLAFASCQKEPALDSSKLELSQKTMVFEKAAGSQTMTITAGKTWVAQFPDGVEWVSVTPKTGSASADPQNITVTVLPNDGYERTATITFTTGLLKETLKVTQKGNNESVETATLDPAKTYAFRKADKVVSGQWYVMVATKNNKLWACNDPSSDATNFSKGFAYPKGIEVEDINGVVNVSGAAAYLFTASADGFTIKNNGSNKYILQTGTYVSFNLTDAVGAGCYWDVTKNDDGTFKINNKAVSKWIVMQDKYDSFGLSQEDGSQPWLYEYVGEAAAPEYKAVTIEQFYASSDSYLSVKGQVVAVGAETMVLNDGGDKCLYVYVGEEPGVFVGDVVQVDGQNSTYGMAEAGYTQLRQLMNVTITKINDNITAKEIDPVVLTSVQIDAPYSSAETSLVTIEGTVVKDGNYINLELDGDVLGSVVESAAGSQLPEGVRLSITGYYAGINKRGYFCILPISSSDSKSDYFKIAETEISVPFSATSATIEVKGNVAWTAVCETEGFTLDKTSGEGAATITVSFAANETEEAKTATVKLSTTAEVATKEYVVTITQKAPAAAGSVEMIDKVENLTAGVYYMAAYQETYTENKVTTTYSPYHYHLWTGKIVNNKDCETIRHSYENSALVVDATDATTGTYAEMELVAVAGKTNVYYIKVGDLYLTSSAVETNRSLKLDSEQTEWTASNHSKGGIIFAAIDKKVQIGSAKAKSAMIRSYKDSSAGSSLTSGLFFFKQN